MKRFISACAFAVLAVIGRDIDIDLNSQAWVSAGTTTQTLHLKQGDSIRLVVNENLSTGYEWIYETHAERAVPEDQITYTVELDEHRVPNSEEGVAGATGTRVIQIRAVKSGPDHFQLVYARPWEVMEGQALGEHADNGHHLINLEIE